MAIAIGGSFLKKLKGSITNITLRGFRTQTVAQGKRVPGQINPSPEFIQSQSVASQLSQIYQRILGVVRSGWTSKASNQSEYNAWYSENYSGAFNLSSPPTATINLANLKTTKGVMTTTPIVGLTADDSSATVAVAYSSSVMDATQRTADTALVAIYNTTQSKWFTAPQPGAQRGDSAFTISVPVGFMTTGDTLRVYVSFVADPTETNAGTSSTSVNDTVVVAA